MGHTFGNVLGINSEGLNEKIRKLIPGYMVMGQEGMAEMGEMGMAVPPNSLPMVGARGPHDYITMGGMFTLLKVRQELPDDGADPGWYENPPGSRAEAATSEDLKRDAIELPKDLPKTAQLSERPGNDVWCRVQSGNSPSLARNEVAARVKVE
jgi:hypothetical protein